MPKHSFLQRRALSVALGALFIAAVSPAAAQANPVVVDKRIVAAKVFIEESKPELACALIKRSHGADTRHAEALYLLALCSRDLGDREESIGYYERLVEVLPEAPRPKAELAALYAHVGRVAEAQRLYREAARLQPGTASASMFEQLAGAIISDNPAQVPTPAKLWETNVGLSMIHDNNLNAGPTATTTAAVIGGVPVELDLHPSTRPRSSWGSVLSAGGRYLKPLSNRWGVLFQGDLSGTSYFSAHEFDTESVAFGAAFIHRGATSTFSIQPNARYVRRDEALQEATHGLSTNLGWRLSPSLQLGGSLGYFHRRVPVANANDANGYTAGVSLQKSLSNRLQVGGQYFYQFEDAQKDVATRTMHGPSLFAMYPFSNSLQLLANYRYVALDYDERQPLFRDAREDDQHQFSLGAKLNLRQWTGQNLELVARYNYTDNDSNLAHYDHDREVVTFGLQGRF